jgi:hypothetical protein
MALASLDNQVIFKKLFRDPDILQAFLYDLIGVRLSLRPEQIEMERKFAPPIGNVDMSIDIFVDDPEHRLIIEMQREYYDYHYDRFLYYHQAATMDLVQNYKSYRLSRTVHTIVWLTQKVADPTFHHSLITTRFCSDAEDGEQLTLYPHKLYFLNPFYLTDKTPAGVADWMQLVLESILNPTQPQVNLQRPEIVRSLSLIDDGGLTPQERAAMLDAMELQLVLYRREQEGIKVGREEGIKVGREEGKREQSLTIARGMLPVLDDVAISQITGLSIAEVQQLRGEG